MVKLAQFRAQGSFVKKITNSSNFNVLLQPHDKGSFNINVTAPVPTPGEKRFVDLSIADLLAYLSERIVEKSDEGDLISTLNANSQTLAALGQDRVKNSADADAAIEEISKDQSLRRGLHPETREIVERRIAEITREGDLEEKKSEVAKIDSAREQKLLSMGAPLVSEMATALRRSANSLEVVARRRGVDSTVLYLNKRMAQEIENAKVDSEITPILGDIIQYNKENGWGKVRLGDVAPGPISFSIPSDLKYGLQSLLITQMRKDQVYLQAYFVRDRGDEVVRLIVVGILPVPER
jgi:hypothetical protein